MRRGEAFVHKLNQPFLLRVDGFNGNKKIKKKSLVVPSQCICSEYRQKNKDCTKSLHHQPNQTVSDVCVNVLVIKLAQMNDM